MQRRGSAAIGLNSLNGVAEWPLRRYSTAYGFKFCVVAAALFVSYSLCWLQQKQFSSET